MSKQYRTYQGRLTISELNMRFGSFIASLNNNNRLVLKRSLESAISVRCFPILWSENLKKKKICVLSRS